MNIPFIILIVVFAYLPNITALVFELRRRKKDLNIIFMFALLFPFVWYIFLFIGLIILYQEKRKLRKLSRNTK